MGAPHGKRTWDAVLRAMREHDCNFHEAMRATGVDRKTIRGWWHNGQAGSPWGSRPMKEQYAAETAEALAAVQRAAEQDEKDREGHAVNNLGPDEQDVLKVRKARVDALKEEAMIVRFARGNVLSGLTMTTRLLNAAGKLATDIEAQLLAPQKETEKVTLAQAMGHIRTITTLCGSLVVAANGVMEAQRRLMGEDESGSDESTLADGMSTEQAIEELRQARAVFTNLEKTGRLQLVKGGKYVGPLARAEAEEDVPEDALASPPPPPAAEGPHPVTTSPSNEGEKREPIAG